MNNSTNPGYLPISNGQAASLSLSQMSNLNWEKEKEFDLKQLMGILRRRAFVIIGIALGTMTYSLGSTLLHEPIYESKFQVLVEPVNAENDVSEIATVVENTPLGAHSGLDYETQVQVLRSPELMEQVATELRQTYPDINAESLLKGLQISRLANTKILEIRYQGNDPVKIQVILDKLAETYLNYSLAERQTNLRQGIQFVDKQLPTLKSRVDQLQLELERFGRNHSFINPDIQAQQIANQSQQLSDKRFEIQQEIVQANARIQQFQTRDGGYAALKDAAVYQNLIQQMRSVEAEIATELTRFQPNSLTIRVLKEKRDNLLPLIEAEAQRVIIAEQANARANLQMFLEQDQSLNQAEVYLNESLESLPSLTRQYNDLQREVKLATDALNRFLTTKESLEIAASQKEIPWQLIEAPIKPIQPIFPNPQRSLMLGIIGSALLGMGGALLLEKFDRVYRSLELLQTDIKLPLLGTMPLQGKSVEVGSQQALLAPIKSWMTEKLPIIPSTFNNYDYSSALLLESLHVVNTNLQLLSSDRPIRSIVISSSMPGEGKSTLAVHLAKTAATMGKKVLLVDADLRKPQVHNQLQISNQAGLTDLVTGQVSKEEVIQRAISFLDFHVITAGQIPPDPISLLSSRKMQQLIKDFEKEFDLVIYDTPPLVGLADAILLAPHTNGLVLITRINKTHRDLLNHALSGLKVAKIPVLGWVANGVPTNTAYGYYDHKPYAMPEGLTFNSYQNGHRKEIHENGHPETFSKNGASKNGFIQLQDRE